MRLDKMEFTIESVEEAYKCHRELYPETDHGDIKLVYAGIEWMLATIKQLAEENERLQFELKIQMAAKGVAVDVSIESMDKYETIQQQLKQAITGLEDIKDYQHRWSDSPIREVQKIAHQTLSIIREEQK